MKAVRLLIIPVLISFILFQGCGSQDESAADTINPDDLPKYSPAQLTSFDRVGDFFFDHLNYTTVPLQNGHILIHDREEGFILEITTEGEPVKQIAREGRGPGEILDASRLHADAHEKLVVYDQFNQKVVRYDTANDEHEEFTAPAPEEYRVRTVYPLNAENRYLVFQWKPSAIMEDSVDPVNRLLIYDRESESYTIEQNFPEQQMAQLIVDDQVRGASPVPYSPQFLYEFSSHRDHIFVSWTETNEIAKLTADLDTVTTLQVPLEKEPLTRAEVDSLEEWTNSNSHHNQWRTIEEKLPETKVSFNELKIDHLDRFWLKLTRQSADQEWLVLSADGEPQKTVRLPREGMITHISEDHIGFRENDYTFSLYEPVE